MKYFHESELHSAKKTRNKYRFIYVAVAVIYAVISVGCILWFTTLPYKSSTITTVKVIHYSVTGVFIAFSFVYLFITYKCANRYYKLVNNLATGLKEKSTAAFFEVDNTIQDKDGVDMKSLIFLEWNKFKQDYYERKVLVFADRPVPEIPQNAMVEFITQGNVLIEYDIVEYPEIDDGDLNKNDIE